MDEYTIVVDDDGLVGGLSGEYGPYDEHQAEMEMEGWRDVDVLAILYCNGQPIDIA